MTEAADRKAGKAMGKMEETITGLRDDMATAKTPPANHFKPLWLLATIIAVALISVGTFVAVGRLTEVDDNTKAIDQGCEARNEALAVINHKFAQLNVLFDASLSQSRDSNRPPPTEEILRLYAEFKKPIPLKPCDEGQS